MIKQTFWFDRIYNALFPLSRTSSTWHFFTINDNQAEILIWQNTQCPWTHVPEHQVQYIKQPALSAAALFSVDQCHCSLSTIRLINVNVSTASKWSDQLLRRLDRLIWWPEKNWLAWFVHIHNYHFCLFYSKIFFASLQIPNPNFCLFYWFFAMLLNTMVAMLAALHFQQLCNFFEFPSFPRQRFVHLDVQRATHLERFLCNLFNLSPPLNMLWASDREGRVPFVTECVTKNDDVTIVKEVASVIMSLPALPIHSLAL